MANTFCLHNRGPGANPIAHVLQAIDEPLDLIEYNRWNVILPEGQFLTEVRLLLLLQSGHTRNSYAAIALVLL